MWTWSSGSAETVGRPGMDDPQSPTERSSKIGSGGRVNSTIRSLRRAQTRLLREKHADLAPP
jgi:hypothetical protein